MDTTICSTCRTVQAPEARCWVCNGSLHTPLPTQPAEEVEERWTLSDDKRRVNSFSLAGLIGCIALGAFIVVTAAKVRSPLMVLAAIAMLILFVGPQLLGVPTRRRITRATVEILPAADKWAEALPSLSARVAAGRPGELLVSGQELHGPKGLLARVASRKSVTLELRVDDETVSVSGPAVTLRRLASERIDEARARQLFDLPALISLPAELTLVQTGVQDGERCQVSGPLTQKAEPTGYRETSFARAFAGAPGTPVVLR